MLCALCKLEKVLRHSHIIPEFMYSTLYDELHRFEVLSSKPSNRRPFVQKGLRERLLCDDCEDKFSNHEGYASRFFSGELQVASGRKGDVVAIHGLDYVHFKLFALSILWRAGVSRNAMFDQVKLGPHEERLRRLLLAGNQGDPEQYGFVLTALTHEGEAVTDLIVAPTRSRIHGRICYRFVFGGIVWIFTVGNSLPVGPVRDAVINRRGDMSMLVAELKDITFLTAAMTHVFGSYSESN